MKIDEIYVQKCLEPSDISEHLPVLKEYASKCKHVTEFGVRTGVSTWAFLAGRPGQLTSYDLVSPGEKTLYEMQNSGKNAGVFFVFYQVDVLQTVIAQTDLLFIDTFHTYQQLKRELNRHAGDVRKWIILHDTEIFGLKGEDGSFGLEHAIQEFLIMHKEWFELKRYTNNNGLTILERK